MSENQVIAALLIKHNHQETTPEEEKVLQDWRYKNKENEDCYNRLTDPEQVLTKVAQYMYNKPDVHLAHHNVMQRIEKRRKIVRYSWISGGVIAAAATVIAAIFWLPLWMEKSSSNGTTTVAKQTFETPATAPFGKALLVIENKAVINLDTIKDGLIGEYGYIRIEKEKQVIRYKPMGNSLKGDLVYTKLITGAACQYKLILPDNSAIDLSASSWVRIGSTPNIQQRGLELAGQAYFNVMHDDKKPFIVTVNKTEIEVLGTEFNVNAYDVKGSIKTALVNGRVKIKSGRFDAELVQGEIATVIPGQPIKPEKANVDKEINWKEGHFIFNADNIVTVMNELSQWYNIDVRYIDTPKTSITSMISRTTELDVVLNLINEQHTVTVKRDAVNPKLVTVSEWKN